MFVVIGKDEMSGKTKYRCFCGKEILTFKENPVCYKCQKIINNMKNYQDYIDEIKKLDMLMESLSRKGEWNVEYRKI